MRRTIFGEDHVAFRGSVREFVDRCVRPQLAGLAELRELGRELWLEAGRQGFLGLNVPEEFGGGGAGDWRFSAVLSEELARGSAALASCLSIQYDVVAPYLVELTTSEQKKRWLPGLCSGELVTAIAMTEPSGGSDLASLRTVAVSNGPDWVISGSKIFITNGYGADLVIVAAKTNPDLGANGITLFAVETGMPGFSRGGKLDKIGQHEADTCELFFDSVRVAAGNIIGEVGRGFAHMMTMLPQERIGAAVTNLGHVRPVFEQTVAYCRERHAFGQPIGSLQYNKFRLAEMATSLDVATAYVDSCVAAHAAGHLSAVDAAKAKWWSAHVQNEVIDGCLQLHGGYGYMRDYTVAAAWADARVTRIWGGSNEIMKEIIGRDLGL